MKILTALIAVLIVNVSAFAASDPPQVGETSRLLVKTTTNTATWSVAAVKDGAAYGRISSIATFTYLTSFAPGAATANVTWAEAGHYLVKCHPTAGSDVTYSVDVVDRSQAGTCPTGSSFALATSIDKRLTAAHGTGLWSSAGSVTVLPFQGGVSYSAAAGGDDVHVFRGDSVSIPYSVGKDITGWEVWFGAKSGPADTAYAVPLRNITAQATDPAAGGGLIILAASDTAIPPRRYLAEIELRKSGEVSTALRFNLWIDADVIR